MIDKGHSKKSQTLLFIPRAVTPTFKCSVETEMPEVFANWMTQECLLSPE